jgi:hypothetical protein
VTDSILHYIWLCTVVKLFWNQVNTWLEEIFDISIVLNMANIVFITNVNECPLEIIEFVILFTKYYIHCCKWSQKFLLTMFLTDSKTVLLQGKARYNEELSQCHLYKCYKGPNSLSQF